MISDLLLNKFIVLNLKHSVLFSKINVHYKRLELKVGADIYRSELDLCLGLKSSR